jgi:hypothetical protein
MGGITRRLFVRSVAALLPVAVLPGCDAPETPGAAAADPLDVDTLGAVAEAVLPSELGPQARERVIQEFRDWLRAYQPVAELNHGYGTGEIRYTPPDPAPGWGAQLRALDLEARKRFETSFAALDMNARREMIRGHIAGDRLERLPDTAEARHVAVGLLSYFYGTPAATDLCYRAVIGKNTCRPLSESPEKPVPLAREA